MHNPEITSNAPAWPGQPNDGSAWLNVGCGTHNAPRPWWNIDVVRDDASGTLPDEVVSRGPLPYQDASCERVLLSHLMEHVPWGAPLMTALADFKRVLRPGGVLFAIGPDAERTARLWKAGQLPDELMWSVLEHANGRHDLDGTWPEARHWWNCTEARMVLALDAAGFTGVAPIPTSELPGYTGDWPLVGAADWQCAAICTVP